MQKLDCTVLGLGKTQRIRYVHTLVRKGEKCFQSPKLTFKGRQGVYTVKTEWPVPISVRSRGSRLYRSFFRGINCHKTVAGDRTCITLPSSVIGRP